MDKNSVTITKKFTDKVRNKFNINKFIFFGSRARGDNLLNSDYDFIIVADYFKKIRFIFRAGAFYDYWTEPVDIEILCYTQEEFEKKKKQIGIVQQAIEEGIEI